MDQHLFNAPEEKLECIAPCFDLGLCEKETKPSRLRSQAHFAGCCCTASKKTTKQVAATYYPIVLTRETKFHVVEPSQVVDLGMGEARDLCSSKAPPEGKTSGVVGKPPRGTARQHPGVPRPLPP